MAKSPIDELRDRYDNLVRRIMDELKRAIADLVKQKDKIIKQRALEIRDIHEGRKEMFKASKEEFYADAAAKGQEISRNNRDRIDELERELIGLLETELQGEGRVYRSHVDYQNAISATIQQLNGLWNYIHENSGVPTGVGRLFGANKGRRRHLPVEPIYNRIIELYVAITKREEEEELNEEHFLFFKEKVENEADRILEQLGAITGVRSAVKRPRTARVSGLLSKARERVEKAPGQVKAGIGDAGLRVVMAKENIGRGIGGAIGRLPNPLPSLRKWASSVGNTAKRLKDKIRRKQDTSQEQAKAAAAEVLGQEVEERVNILLRVAQGIRNFNPGKSASLVGLTNKIKALHARIFVNLKKLRIPGLTKKQAEEIAAEVDADATAAAKAAGEAETELQRLIMEVVATKPTGITREQAEEWLMKPMPDIDIETIAGQMKPGVAERTQRSKDTNLQGKSRGRRGFSSDARQPYNRNQAKREAEREIREEGY